MSELQKASIINASKPGKLDAFLRKKKKLSEEVITKVREIIGTQLTKSEEDKLKHEFVNELHRQQSIRLPENVLDYSVQDMTLIICRNKGKYLVLKFRKDYDYCPGDWDFVTRHPYTGKSSEQNAVEAVKHHIGLDGEILQSYTNYIWLDLESKIWWHYYPFLMETSFRDVQFRQNGKYSEYLWVDRYDITKFSRLDYLENSLDRTINKVQQVKEGKL
jgi:hypothetical protein